MRQISLKLITGRKKSKKKTRHKRI